MTKLLIDIGYQGKLTGGVFMCAERKDMYRERAERWLKQELRKRSRPFDHHKLLNIVNKRLKKAGKVGIYKTTWIRAVWNLVDMNYARFTKSRLLAKVR